MFITLLLSRGHGRPAGPGFYENNRRMPLLTKGKLNGDCKSVTPRRIDTVTAGRDRQYRGVNELASVAGLISRIRRFESAPRYLGSTSPGSRWPRLLLRTLNH